MAFEEFYTHFLPFGPRFISPTIYLAATTAAAVTLSLGDQIILKNLLNQTVPTTVFASTKG